MPKFKFPTSYILTDDDVMKIFLSVRENNVRFRLCLAIMWVTGARPSEVLAMKWGDIILRDDRNEPILAFILDTLKTGKTKEFKIKKRILTMKASVNFFTRYIAYIKREMLIHPNKKIFERHRSWINRHLSHHAKKVLGFNISPYHFRHSCMTWASRNGATLNQLMYIKGASTLASVKPYIHAKPFMMKDKILKSRKKEDFFVEDKNE